MKEWGFVTNHGLVLSFIGFHPRSTTREIADAVGVTERTAHRIIADLVRSGYLARHKEGRQNIYTVHPTLAFGSLHDRDSAVRELMAALSPTRRLEPVGMPLLVGVREKTPELSGSRR